jgi:hypothetical protein
MQHFITFKLKSMEHLLYIIFLLLTVTTACALVVQGLRMSDNRYNVSQDSLADNKPQVAMETVRNTEHFNKYKRAGPQQERRSEELQAESLCELSAS